MKNRLFLLCSLIFLAACGSGGGSGSESGIRVVNAVSGSSFADVFLNEELRVQNVAYGETSNTFSTADGGGKVTLTIAESAVPAAEDVVRFSPGFDYLLFFTGDLDSAEVINKLVDQISPLDGHFRMRFSNLASEGKSLDFYLLFPGQSVAQGTALDERLGFQAFTKYYDIEDGAYSIVATDRRTKRTVFNTGLLAFESGQSYTFSLLNSQSRQGSFDYSLIPERQ